MSSEKEAKLKALSYWAREKLAGLSEPLGSADYSAIMESLLI